MRPEPEIVPFDAIVMPGGSPVAVKAGVCDELDTTRADRFGLKLALLLHGHVGSSQEAGDNYARATCPPGFRPLEKLP